MDAIEARVRAQSEQDNGRLSSESGLSLSQTRERVRQQQEDFRALEKEYAPRQADPARNSAYAEYVKNNAGKSMPYAPVRHISRQDRR
jgi:hypothetical protein